MSDDFAPESESVAEAAAAIRVAGLSVQLGSHAALDGLDFEVPAGAFLAIIGPNGGGKSTLFKTLLGLVEPTRGRAELFGVAPRLAPAEWIGYVPQAKTLDRKFPARALDLVATGLRPSWPVWLRGERRERAMEALERVGGAGLARKAIGHLSGGELQRVYLARALARRPRLILLDEPAAGMDAAGESDLYRILAQCQRDLGATVLMVTHDWGAAYHHATLALALNRRVVGFGPPSETLTDDCMRETFGHVGHSHAMGLAALRSVGAPQGGCGHD